MASASSLIRQPEFSYDCFLAAMDNFRFFNFFLNRACSIASNIGVRNDKLKEDFAMVAIEEFCGKVDKFDPSRGEFKSFFDASIGNSIKTQIRKSRADKVFGLNNQDRENLENYGEILTNEEEELILKRERFVDEMVEKIKEYIDTLPDDMRAIIYRSEFGRKVKSVLGEDSSKRGYSELIEARNKRTAVAIRKIAERLKDKAIGYAYDRGYNKETYNTINFYIAMPKDKIDFPAFDWSSLSGVQRLKLRMYLYKKAVVDGVISEE